MIQGTASDVGKSTICAAICRVLARKNIPVAPFKPQNMALNSAVTEDGGEIGRAQALQAQACKIPAHTDMNPVLIKPSSDTGAQIILCGKAQNNMSAQEFHGFKPQALGIILDAFTRLQKKYSNVVIEGAGSPAEINLRQGDIANMGFAEQNNCPVILVGDIDKGGVFAQFVGTLELLAPHERALVKGFIINKFRGDIKLLEPGLHWLEERTGKPVLGVLPYQHKLYVDAEDAIDIRQNTAVIQGSLQTANSSKCKVLVPVFPRISNHNDFDALRAHPAVELIFASLDEAPPPCDLIILPGSKNVRQDLSTLKQSPWLPAIKRHLRYGGKLIGICGGFQMLGHNIADSFGIEGDKGDSEGLKLLRVNTSLEKDKVLSNKSGELHILGRIAKVKGYEIHHGATSALNSEHTCHIQFSDNSADGYLSEDNQVFGTYLHGLFDEKQSCDLLLQWAGLNPQSSDSSSALDLNAVREEMLNTLADSLESHLNMKCLATIMGIGDLE